ncbi:MAG: hypothetical protein V1859_01175 [archaeon]
MGEAIDKIRDDVESLKKEVMFLKSNMVDPDSILTEEDFIHLLAYRDEKSKRMLVSEKDIKKELEL